MVFRQQAFLLDDERFEPSDKWTALFCKREDAGQCVVATIAITQSRSTREHLLNGQDVPALVYPSRPDDITFMLIKGLQVPEGAISNVVGQRRIIADQATPIAGEPASVALGSETYELRADGLNLLIEERGKTRARQTVPLFIDPDKRCDRSADNSLGRRIELVWMGDLDHDQRADFLIYASSFRSCALPILREDPEFVLILSSKSSVGEIGQVIKPVGNR